MSDGCFGGLCDEVGLCFAALLGPSAPRKVLEFRVRRARSRAEALQRALDKKRRENSANPDLISPRAPNAPIRIFMEGAFDLMHYGHMNAFRQGKALGDVLIVGVNSDSSITECKGPPVLNDFERQESVTGCRFVNEMVPNTPYVMTPEYLQWIVEEYKIDYVVHGDDPCIVDGKDVYAEVKAKGIYRSIPRTEGISTTDVLGRILLLSTAHHVGKRPSDAANETETLAGPKRRSASGETFPYGVIPDPPEEWACNQSKFLTTGMLLRLFSDGLPSRPTKKGTVVYVDGAWDMFHAGHIKLLRKARELGTFLIAGVHADADVNAVRGGNYPLMNMHERLLSVLGCRYVDDVLIEAPWKVTRQMIDTLGIDLVVVGTVRDEVQGGLEADDAYEVAKEMGILRVVHSDSKLSVSELVHRISQRCDKLEERFRRKAAAEEQFFKKKHAGSAQ